MTHARMPPMSTPPTRRTQAETINKLIAALNAEGEAIQNIRAHLAIMDKRLARLEEILKPEPLVLVAES